MRYTLLLHYSEEDSSTLGPEVIEAWMEAFAAYAAALEQAKVLISGEVLQPSVLTPTEQVREGGTRIRYGPLRETNEQLGETDEIEVPHLESAGQAEARAPREPRA